MKAYMLILMMLMGVISVSAAYDLAQTGYWIPSYYMVYEGQGTQSLKQINEYNSYATKPDFRKSTFRPITRVITGPSLAWQRQVPVLADTGAGLYVPFDTYSGDMPLKDMDMKARGGPNPYVGIYGVERQAIKTYNPGQRNFGSGTAGGYLNPGIPNMIRSAPQYVSAGLPAYVGEGSMASATAQ